MTKTIVVIGATGGIGSVLTHKLSLSGVNLVLAARNNDNLSQLAYQLKGTGAVMPLATDITNPLQVQSLMQAALQQFGRIDVLVNVAGAAVMKTYDKITPEDIDYMINLNLKGSFYTSQAAANIMKEQKSGHICNVIGILGKHPMAMASAYCASKYGMVGYSKCMAEELKRYGVKFTLCYFGGINTPFWDQVSLKVDRSKMLTPNLAADAIYFAINAETNAVPLEINIQPESHLFL